MAFDLVPLLLLALTHLHLTHANPVATTTSPTTTATTPTLPATSDDAPGGSSPTPSALPATTSIYNYYFVFLALLVCVAGLGIFALLRRHRRRAHRRYHSREHALAADLRAWDARNPRRRYWAGRWRSVSRDDVVGVGGPAREEGLNERGEAPPPYVPKREGEGEGEREGDGVRDEEEGQSGAAGLAVPLRVLDRESAGLKPPDYMEAEAQEVEVRREDSVHRRDG